jgi:multimeric flavodoxin WrbA
LKLSKNGGDIVPDKIERNSFKILGIMGGTRKGGNTEVIIESGLEGAQSIPGAYVTKFSFVRKKIEHCKACYGCTKDGVCVQHDDFKEFYDAWREADGIIYAVPVYQMGIPSIVKAAIDRLTCSMWMQFPGKMLPRFMKAAGVIAQGTSRFGGQELTMQYLIEHMIQMNCLPVAADTPESCIGAPGIAGTVERGSIKSDEIGLATARQLGKRVAEVTKIIKNGLDASKEWLPAEYDFDAWHSMLEQPNNQKQ